MMRDDQQKNGNQPAAPKRPRLHLKYGTGQTSSRPLPQVSRG
jgi:hypothetical protein